MYPGAPQACDGKNNDCGDPGWSLPPANEADPTDADSDGYPEGCDTCAGLFDPSQTDFDSDSEGDACDLDDGVIYVAFSSRTQVAWQAEPGHVEWNVYRGDLQVLKDTGVYSQLPGSNPLARQDCGLASPQMSDSDPVASGQVAFYLAAGVTAGGLETGLGEDGAGNPRPHANPCPP